MEKNTNKRQNRLSYYWLLLSVTLVFLSTGCDLYINSEAPKNFYEFKDFDILELGKNITDLVMDPTEPYLYLSDYGNNQVLRIDVRGKMRVDKKLVLGSHPIALDITPDQSKLVVAFYGESKLSFVDLETFTLVESIPISLKGLNDIICASENRIFISALTEPNVMSLELPSRQEQLEIIRSGELIASPDQKFIFVATNQIVQKYDISSGFAAQVAWSAPYGYNAKINDFVLSPTGTEAFLCIADKDDHNRVRDVIAFNTDDLSLAGNYEIKSAGMGVAISRNGKRVFVAPTDADAAGVFVVEFDGDTKLEKHYYLVAGNLKERGIVLDQSERYLYVIVNIPGDDDSFEPYNNNSFDLQRIEIY